MGNRNTLTIFHNGKIFTANDDQFYASAMVVKDGRLAWVGQDDEIEGMEGERVDLEQRRVIPGFIDAHMHPLHLAKTAKQVPCTPPKVQSITDLIQEIKSRKVELPEGAWLEGWGFDEGKLTERRTPTRWDLDKASSNTPALFMRAYGHIAVANSVALRLAGITRETPDPAGGEIDRDENGEPTGILKENAKDLVAEVMPSLRQVENISLLTENSKELARLGITTITDLMARKKEEDDMDLYSLAHQQGLKQRVVIYYKWEDIKDDPRINEEAKNRANPVYVGGLKLFADGSVSGRTAWVNTPYIDQPDNVGIQTTTKKELLDAAEAAEQNGVQLAVHAMGEQAIKLIVETFADRPGWLNEGPSIRIEHASFLNDDITRLAVKAGIAFVTQPIFVYSEIESYLGNLGLERTQLSYPIRMMLEHGATVAFSSDAPGNAWAEPVDPFIGIKSAVTRRAYDGSDIGQNEKIDTATAIKLYTRVAQEVTRVPGIGQLQPGNHADFIILDRDILDIDAESIDQVQVVETYINGECVYKK
ncbi:amidohydrolase [Thalassobacillus pellis]|uniref:amidohydrolase n=1 Tax=Thalassobacillus pellis TaxID=748008 RepID=UPI001961ABD6|nr:amidohydrolase [Thalassobacillus pellis]MBM7553370.1 putative amidohydrolase YtcJ [Thalassobacillus pellis]